MAKHMCAKCEGETQEQSANKQSAGGAHEKTQAHKVRAAKPCFDFKACHARLSLRLLYHEAKMFACKCIFAKPSSAQAHKVRAAKPCFALKGKLREPFTALIIPHFACFSNEYKKFALLFTENHVIFKHKSDFKKNDAMKHIKKSGEPKFAAVKLYFCFISELSENQEADGSVSCH